MQAFHNIIDQYDRPISYLGYFYTVAMLLKDFDMTSAKSILDLVKKTTQELFNSLQGTNSVIKNFIDKLLADKDATPESIMSTFLIDYQKKVVVTALKNLIGKDNPSSTYLTGILHKLESLYTDELGEVVFHYSQELDQESIGNEQPLDVAKREVTEILQYCLESYRGVKEFIETIDQRNNRYHRNTREKIHFLANNRRDVEGKLTSAIKALKNIPNNADLEDVIPLEYIGLVDDHSFFSRTHTTTPKSSIHTQIPLVDPEEIERAKAEFQRQNLFSREEINRFVLELLGSHRSIRASEIPIQNYDDLYRLLLIRIYAQYPSMGYTLSEPEAEFVAFNHRMADFVIRRKEG